MPVRGLEPLVLPLTCGILVALFAIQRRGTGSIGKLFGPVMTVWFVTLAVLGVYHIVAAARDPRGAVAAPRRGLLLRHGIHGMLILGSVVLAVTGGEALYADMGHFGVRPIRLAWTFFVLPALALCYFGQGRWCSAIRGPIENRSIRWCRRGCHVSCWSCCRAPPR